jgi:hypothetical protein
VALAALVAAVCSAGVGHATDECLNDARQVGCSWQPAVDLAVLDDRVRAFAAYDDGSGPALFAGGHFITAGGVTVNHIAKWDGTTWSALSGPLDIGTDYTVLALAVFDDGSGPALFAGGSFTTAGGVFVNSIAKWDGTAWSALSGPSGTGMVGWVGSLAVFDDGSGPALYAGGGFFSAGGVPVYRIAKWDGIAWSALSGPSGTGTDDHVIALAAGDSGGGPALFAGGMFTSAGGLETNHIAKWDGTAWSALSGPSGTGTSDWVFALAVFDEGSGPALYAGGWFLSAGGVVTNYIAKWDGTAWSALSGPSGNGTDNVTMALTAFDDGSGPALFAGGHFLTAGGVTVNRIARWDGNAWSALSGPSGTGMDEYVEAVAGFDDGSRPTLFAGGWFTRVGGYPSPYIAAWRCVLFTDGFESGNTSAWSVTVP